MLLVCEPRGQVGDNRFQLQGLLDLDWQGAQFGHHRCLALRRQPATASKSDPEQQQRGQLGGKGLGGRNPDFRPGVSHECQVRRPHQRAFVNVAYGERMLHAHLLGGFQRGNGVRRFA